MDILREKKTKSNSSRGEILKYIKTEKEISTYSIQKLEKKNSLDPTKRRILEIEREFVSLPLELMDFEDVADVAAAISIYRSSRGLFYKTYDVDGLIRNRTNKEFFEVVENKISLLDNIAAELMVNRVQEVNVVQDQQLFNELVDYSSLKNDNSVSDEINRLKELTLDELLAIEPLRISKKRARLQAALYSLGLYIHEHVRACALNKDMSRKELQDVSRLLDFIILDAKNNIFKYYNVSLKFLADEMMGTMGENRYLAKIHQLTNLLDYDDLIRDVNELPCPFGHEEFSFEFPSISNLFLAHNGKKSKCYGILFPLQRKGNEKMSPLYKEVYFGDLSIESLFCDQISNVKVEGPNGEEYYKAILLRPLKKIAVIEEDPMMKEFISKISGLKSGILNLPSKKNMILAPKTRSEEEGIAEILPIVEKKIDNFSDDYFKLFGTTNEMN